MIAVMGQVSLDVLVAFHPDIREFLFQCFAGKPSDGFGQGMVFGKQVGFCLLPGRFILRVADRRPEPMPKPFSTRCRI
jgi:hypothetical protein